VDVKFPIKTSHLARPNSCGKLKVRVSTEAVKDHHSLICLFLHQIQKIDIMFKNGKNKCSVNVLIHEKKSPVLLFTI